MVTVKVKKYLGSHNVYGELSVGVTVDVDEEFYKRYDESLIKVNVDSYVEPEQLVSDTDDESEDNNESEVEENG